MFVVLRFCVRGWGIEQTSNIKQQHVWGVKHKVRNGASSLGFGREVGAVGTPRRAGARYTAPGPHRPSLLNPPKGENRKRASQFQTRVRVLPLQSGTWVTVRQGLAHDSEALPPLPLPNRPGPQIPAESMLHTAVFFSPPLRVDNGIP